MFFNAFIAEIRQKYKLLVLITIAFLVVGISIGVNTEDKWTSKSLLKSPTYNQTSSLFSALKALSSVGNNSVAPLTLDYVFEEFLSEVTSIDNKRDYLQSIGLEASSSQVDKIIKVIVTADKKLVEVSFISTSALEAQEKLKGYLSHVSSKINDEFIEYTQNSVNSIQKSLMIKSDILEKTASYRLESEKEKLKFASEITKKSGIKKPIIDPGLDMNLPIALGSEVINSQLKEYQINSYNVFRNDFHVKSRLDVLKSINLDSIDIEPFRYQIKPELPEYKTSPNLKKYTILALLLSMVVSVTIIIYGIRNTIICKLK